MKKTILFLALAVCSVHAFAQDDEDDKAFKFGLGGTISLPLSDLKEVTSYGVGFEVLASYKLAENIGVFAQTGVNVFKTKSDYGGDAANLLHIPFMGGARFYAGGFFAGAGVGYGRWSSSGASVGGFLYSPQVGYDLGRIQVLLNYTSTSLTGGSYSYAGLKFFRTF